MDSEDIYVIVGSFCIAMGIILEVNTNIKYMLFSLGGFLIVIGFFWMLKRKG